MKCEIIHTNSYLKSVSPLRTNSNKYSMGSLHPLDLCHLNRECCVIQPWASFHQLNSNRNAHSAIFRWCLSVYFRREHMFFCLFYLNSNGYTFWIRWFLSEISLHFCHRWRLIQKQLRLNWICSRIKDKINNHKSAPFINEHFIVVFIWLMSEIKRQSSSSLNFAWFHQ